MGSDGSRDRLPSGAVTFWDRQRGRLHQVVNALSAVNMSFRTVNSTLCGFHVNRTADIWMIPLARLCYTAWANVRLESTESFDFSKAAWHEG